MRGKVISEWESNEEEEDHPRLCGEKDLIDAVDLAGGRITPAYAGKSPRCPSAVTAAEDHPRLCGEKPNLTIYDDR